MHPNSDEARERNRMMWLSKAAKELEEGTLEFDAFKICLDNKDRKVFEDMRQCFKH